MPSLSIAFAGDVSLKLAGENIARRSTKASLTDRFRNAAGLTPQLAAALRDTPFAVYLDRRPVAGRETCFVARVP